MAGLPDPVGEVLRGSTLANGLELRQVRVPFGVVGIIYEARPNVTADAAGICLKSGNAALLRGSSSARREQPGDRRHRSATAIEDAGLPPDAVQLVPGEGHDGAKVLMRARGLVDVLIPRGGAGLIRSVVEESTVPVIETGVGNCHVYVDAAADLDKALSDRDQRQDPSHQRVQRGRDPARPPRRRRRLPPDGRRRPHRGRGDRPRRPAVRRVRRGGCRRPTTTSPGSTSASTSRRPSSTTSTPPSRHIRAYSSKHTDAIVTEDQAAARRFAAEVDSAAVLVNASTRFTDGGEFGFGAEIGISTQKLHARGPMGLPEMTSTKYVVTGDGHVR